MHPPKISPETARSKCDIIKVCVCVIRDIRRSYKKAHCLSQTSCCIKFCTVTGINVYHSNKCYSRELKSYHMKKISATGRKLLSLDTGKNLLSQEEIYCGRKKFTVTERNLLSQKEIYCQKKNRIDCHRKKSQSIGTHFL